MVERRLRLEVAERIDAAGAVVEPLDEASVRAAIERIRREGAAAVAVCLLHSYRNPAHERRVGELVRDALPGVYLSLSVDVLPEIREYERTSTTVINAYVGPVVAAYLASLGERLGDDGRGRAAADDAVERRRHVGAGGGRAAGAHRRVGAGGRRHRRPARRAAGRAANLITFDMGGTTAKASLIEDGEIGRTTEFEVGAGISLSSRLVKGGGYALKLPVLDIAEVGAGGGSIVWLDRGGALKVGPRSAGAVPGPVCYGTRRRRSRRSPTPTSSSATSTRAAWPAARCRSTPDGRERRWPSASPSRWAWSCCRPPHGVYTLANASMIRAIKAVST